MVDAITAAKLLSTAADALDKHGIVAGVFFNDAGNMCVHGALNFAQNVLSGVNTIDSHPGFEVRSFDRSRGTPPMLAAIEALISAGATPDLGTVERGVPWVAVWSNTLVRDGDGAEVIATLRRAAANLENAHA